MKCSIERDELRAALKVTAPAMGRGTHRPVLTGARLDLAGDALTVTCTNLDRTIHHTCAARCGDPGSVIAPVGVMRRVADACASGAITLTAGDGHVTVTDSGGFTATINTLAADAWPKIDRLKNPEHTVTIAGDMRRIIERATVTTSRDDTRPVLCGVWMHADGVISSSDSHMGSITETGEALPDLNIPADTLGDALKASDGDLTLTTDGRDIELVSDGTVWSCRSIPGDHPNVARALPANDGDTVTVGLADALGAIRALAAIGDNSSALSAQPVILSTDGGSMRVDKREAGVADASCTVDCAGEFPGVVALSPRRLATILGAMDTDEATLHVHGPHKPVVTTAGPTTFLIMPVRVS